ncbi:hypothetical protein GCM10010981_46090 [Dyella nitratireducens]|uniref:Uncharacterized protein n=1 Tax=Dyella nitratireducens TaxID=1849580 RepID=A0ABQ1GWN9_9GAMM|nr:hypothetical protein GCM10010981_46090 [Dyella nitratireducens]GLQ41699.1 hypothetical protein GCM10007902_15490 [Dyella nitratireducens]
MAEPGVAFLAVAKSIAQELATKDSFVIERYGYRWQVSGLATNVVRMNQASLKCLHLRFNFDRTVIADIKPGIASQYADPRRLGEHRGGIIWCDKTRGSNKSHVAAALSLCEEFLGDK